MKRVFGAKAEAGTAVLAATITTVCAAAAFLLQGTGCIKIPRRPDPGARVGVDPRENNPIRFRSHVILLFRALRRHLDLFQRRFGSPGSLTELFMEAPNLPVY